VPFEGGGPILSGFGAEPHFHLPTQFDEEPDFIALSSSTAKLAVVWISSLPSGASITVPGIED